jgi:hypothetical protein
MKSKIKYKTVILRGCEVKVRADWTNKWEALEKKQLEKDWENNRVD